MENNNNELLENNKAENTENIVNDTTQNIPTQSESVQTTGEQPELFQNNLERNKDKNNLKILLGIVIAVIFICLACVFAGAVLKNNEEKFFNLLFQKQSIIELTNGIAEKGQNSMQVDTIIEADIAEIINKLGGDLETDLKIGLNLSGVKEKDDMSGSLEVVLNNKSAGFIHLAKTGELYGGKLDETTQKFVAFENKNLKDLFKKFEVEDAETIPNKILTSKDFEEVIKTDKVTVKKILNNYIEVLAKSAKGKVDIEKNVELEINGEKIKTQKYSLTVNEKEALEMELAIIEELKNDRKTLKLFIEDYKAIIKLMEENGYAVKDMYNVSSDEIPDTNKACDEIQKALKEVCNEIKEEIENVSADGETISINVYEYKNEAVATEIASGDTAIIFKCLANKDVFIALSFVIDGSEYGAIILEGENNTNDLKLDAKLKIQGITIQLFTINQEYKLKADKNIIKLDKESALLINEASKEDIEVFIQEFQNGLMDMAMKLEEKFPEIADMISGPNQDVNVSDFDSYDADYDYNYNNGCSL